MNYELLRKRFFIFIFLLIFIKYASGLSIFKSGKYQGEDFVVVVPVGWEQRKELGGKFKEQGSYEKTELVTFIHEGIDLEVQDPPAKISITSRKLPHAVWIDDEWGDIIRSIRMAGMRVMDQGEIKIGGVISKWVVFHNKKMKTLHLEFYMITEKNMFYKLEYVTEDDKFGKYRPDFEFLKNSWEFKFSLF